MKKILVIVLLLSTLKVQAAILIYGVINPNPTVRDFEGYNIIEEVFMSALFEQNIVSFNERDGRANFYLENALYSARLMGTSLVIVWQLNAHVLSGALYTADGAKLAEITTEAANPSPHNLTLAANQAINYLINNLP
ncbi:MAG: hypothetical protein FWE37_04010 [Spirochaetaceae bacterium]|nr:hypothetical protein [Spirochaetaceae bacterium]